MGKVHTAHFARPASTSLLALDGFGGRRVLDEHESTPGVDRHCWNLRSAHPVRLRVECEDWVGRRVNRSLFSDFSFSWSKLSKRLGLNMRFRCTERRRTEERKG